MKLIPAAPTNMKPWILQVLRDGPHERSELLFAIDKLGRLEGFQASNLPTLKKALGELKDDGLIANVRKGWWTLPADSQIPETKSPAPVSSGRRSMPVLREIGRGDECVYILQFRDDVEAARAANRSSWNCKIGKSKNAAQRLLNVGSNNTFIAKPPEIGLMILCDDADNVEKVIHYTLRKCRRHIEHSAGNEWFETSPDQVANFYSQWVKSCAVFH
jgi:T5orf172 domain